MPLEKWVGQLANPRRLSPVESGSEIHAANRKTCQNQIMRIAVQSIEEALDQLGVRDDALSVAQRRALDDAGYLVLPNAIEPAQIDRMRAAFEAAAVRPADASGGRTETGTRHPSDLIARDPVFAAVCAHPGMLAAVYQVLGRSFRLTQLSGRDPLPGYGQQGLHADWMGRSAQEPYHVVTAIWMLDVFTRENGATRVVPGSHRQLRPPPKAMADPAGHHPNEQFVTGPAGSVLVFNGHLWHSGTRNQSRQSRRALQCVFWAREMIPPHSQPLCDAPETLSPAIRYLLGA
jgi:ectoine hydroxylase-related dioxygenase (phytanoyl-CoA dioxygenase family)